MAGEDKERKVRAGKKGMLIVTVKDLPRIARALSYALGGHCGDCAGTVDLFEDAGERAAAARLLERVQSRIRCSA